MLVYTFSLVSLCLISTTVQGVRRLSMSTTSNSRLFEENTAAIAGAPKGKGKSSRGRLSEFECVGITDIIYVTKEELYELGAARLELESGEPVQAINAAGWDLTYAQAHALAPPRCYLAPMSTETDKIRIIDLSSGLGWMGVYKSFQQAYDDRLEDLSTRREGWLNLDSTPVPELFWNDAEPEAVDSDNTQDTEHAAAYVTGGLSSLPPNMSLPGAYYKCCSLYAFERKGDEAAVDELEDILLSIISIE